MPPKSAHFDHLLHQALAQRHGLVLRCQDPERLRMVLYSARTRLNNPALHSLEFRILPAGLGPEDSQPTLVIHKLADGSKRSARRPSSGRSPEDQLAALLSFD